MGKQHSVQPGEYLMGIARKHGFANWRTIWEHPENRQLAEKRKTPNILYPGDIVYIPDIQVKTETCATGQWHQFEIKKPRETLRVTLNDSDGKGLANLAYTLSVGDKVLTGNTGGDGLVLQEIPVGAEIGTLSLDGIGVEIELKIGHMDPVYDPIEKKDIITGVQGRLNNIGFPCGKVDGILGSKTRSAIRRFQKLALKRADPTGELDVDTRNALLNGHGS